MQHLRVPKFLVECQRRLGRWRRVLADSVRARAKTPAITTPWRKGESLAEFWQRTYAAQAYVGLGHARSAFNQRWLREYKRPG